jgi:hypothetical protein
MISAVMGQTQTGTLNSSGPKETSQKTPAERITSGTIAVIDPKFGRKKI